MNSAVNRAKIRRGDLVTVLTGKDKGKSGKVLRVYPKKGRLLVERINLVKRHTKPSQKIQQGGIIEKEAPLGISKVMVLDPRTNQPSRLGRKRLPDGKLVRFVKKSGEMIEAVKP
ncbi:MAG: 50S ribosomal protein L24 [candidate division FCPU426 bacterium]|jgi:large subunit ribosomal protein L24